MNILIFNLQNNHEALSCIKNRIAETYPEVDVFDIHSKADLDTAPNHYWNSILVVLFDMNSTQNRDLSEIYDSYMQTSDNRGHIIPVSCDTTATLPTPFDRIKSIPLNGDNSENIFLSRVGSFLGLRWIPKESDIFISYKVSDGKNIALQVKKILEDENFNVWLDEDRDDDNEGNIKVGEDCQEVIKAAVDKSSMVILIDTPEAIRSKWVNAEIDYANGSVVPVLPLVFRNDGIKGPSFRSLLELQRWLEFSYDPRQPFTFSEAQTEELYNYIHKYLIDFHNRKKQLPGKIATHFTANSFSRRNDQALEKKLCSIFDRKSKWSRTVFTHAFCYPVFFKTAVQTFSNFLSQLGHSPHHYFIIYDGITWLDSEIDEVRSVIGKDNLRVVHLGELAESIKDT